MENKKIVVALGRIAFGETFPEQQEAVTRAAKIITDLVEENYQIVITTSNSPQIGMFHTAMTEFSRLDNRYTVAPLSVCSALSQGYIGYDLQNAIRTELLNRGIYKTVSTLITQVKVDAFDKAFSQPSKVIGRIMSKAEADIEEQKGNYVTQVGDNAYRRIVASPKPLEIYELDAIQTLMEAGHIVIAASGGGIPVLEQGTKLKGASAIIEKDLTSGLLAKELNADTLLFLTSVEKVSLYHNSSDERPIDHMTVKEASEYLDAGHFSFESMSPKIEASISYVASGENHRAIIAHLDSAKNSLLGRTGTLITNN